MELGKVKRLPFISRIKKRGHLIQALCLLTREVEGGVVEAGVWKGDSARILSWYKKEDKLLYLLDTFKGLPLDTPKDHFTYPGLLEGKFKLEGMAKKDTLKRLRALKGTKILEGEVEKIAPKFLDKCKFSLVHLDIDLYKPTKFCIEFFWERMSRGAIMFIHDYGSYLGVNEAVHGFFKDEDLLIIGAYAIIFKKV